MFVHIVYTLVFWCQCVIVAFPSHSNLLFSVQKEIRPTFQSMPRFTHCHVALYRIMLYEPRHEISNNVVCEASRVSDQPAHTCSLIRAFACRLNIQLLTEHYLEFQSLKGSCTDPSESTLIKMPHCWKSHATAQMLSTDSSCQDMMGYS